MGDCKEHSDLMDCGWCEASELYAETERLSVEIERLTDDYQALLERHSHLTTKYQSLEKLARRMWIAINGDDEFFEDAVSGQQT